MPSSVTFDDEVTAVAQVLLQPRGESLAEVMENYEVMAARLQLIVPALAAQLREQIERMRPRIRAQTLILIR